LVAVARAVALAGAAAVVELVVEGVAFAALAVFLAAAAVVLVASVLVASALVAVAFVAVALLTAAVFAVAALAAAALAGATFLAADGAAVVLAGAAFAAAAFFAAVLLAAVAPDLAVVVPRAAATAPSVAAETATLMPWSASAVMTHALAREFARLTNRDGNVLTRHRAGGRPRPSCEVLCGWARRECPWSRVAPRPFVAVTAASMPKDTSLGVEG
jgi:hypothetical protein